MLISHPSINNKNKRRTMKTKNTLKVLALAMLLPAMLLTTACSSDDDAIVNNEITNKKGYPLQVTINVTRKGDNANTRATYNETDKKLSFSSGDQLFVQGSGLPSASQFAGTLTWQSGGTFSGTIYTEYMYTGTADALLTGAGTVAATLLPDGYDTSYEYLSISTLGYDATLATDATKAFATTKAAAVEQLSLETATSYSSGFALSPQNAILNFTIIGLSASTAVDVVLTGPNSLNISKTVTTDGSGNATFAVGIADETDLKDLYLTVGGKVVTLTSTNKQLAAGRIYNITRSASPLAYATASDLGKVIGADGNIYDTATAASEASTTAVALICYVGNGAETGSTFNHGLAISLSDIEAYQMDYTQATGEYAIPVWAAAHPIAGATWRLPSQKDWQYMLWGYHVDDPKVTNISTSDISTVLVNNGYYWTSTEVDTNNAKTVYYDGTYAGIQNVAKTLNSHVRACLVF